MGDSLSVIFATIVAAIIMFLFPMLDTWERQDDLSYIAAYTAVIDTVDAVRNTGRLTQGMYDSLVSTVNATGNRFKIQLEHREAIAIPGTTPDTYELVYLNHYTNEILNTLNVSGEYTTFDESIIKVEGEGGTLEADGSVTRIPGFRLSIRKIM